MATIVIKWTPTAESTIMYDVRYALDSPTPSYLYFSTTQTTAIIPGLLDNETYIVGVRAICEGDIYSEWTQKQLVTCNSVTDCYMAGTAVYNP